MDTPFLYQPRRKKIGLTALIDVVFILLMFFMLTSTFTHWRTLELHAPVQVESPVEQSEATTPQWLLLSETGALQLHNSDFYLENYRQFSSNSLSAFDLQQPVILIPEQKVSVEAIANVLGLLKTLGFTRTTLGDLQPEPANDE